MKIYALIGFDKKIEKDAIVALFSADLQCPLPCVSLKKETIDSYFRMFKNKTTNILMFHATNWENVRIVEFDSKEVNNDKRS